MQAERVGVGNLRVPLVRWFAALVFVFLIFPTPAGAAEPDFAVPNGWFYSQTGTQGKGFSITNDGNVSFWRDYQRLGGPATLGYPSSWRFVGADGYIYQTTQGALLQWRPEDQRTALANTFDILSNANKDDWLKATKSIPLVVTDDGSRGDPTRSAAIRLSWLEDEGIRGLFLANPNPAAIPDWSQQRSLELYGFPTSRAQRSGPFVVQRFQRVTMQKWVDLVPGMPRPGTVVRVLGGDLLKEAGLIPGEAVASSTPNSSLARIDPELRGRLEMLGSLPVGKELLDIALNRPISIVWAPMPGDIGGLYSARRRWIAINIRWRETDPRGVAALLGHELAHVRDFILDKPIWTTDGCFETEQNAFRTQSSIWESFYGPNGKQGDLNELDRQNNYIVSSLRRDADAFASRVVQVYEHECNAMR